MDMTISLPEPLKSWVEEQAAQAGCASASEYIQQVLLKEQQEQRRRLLQEVEPRLLAALDSGEPVEITPGFWAARRQELDSRLEGRGKVESV